MGLRAMVPALLLAVLLGSVISDPYEEFRSNIESRDTNIAEPAYRLKDNIKPLSLDIDLDVYISGTENRFNGFVEIVIAVEEDAIAQIVLHQNVVRITGVSVYDSNENILPLLEGNNFEIDSYYELLKINLASPINIGQYTLQISYLGVINENPLDRGFYKGYYYVGNEIRYYATTQFQPYHARKAFPCFDEPQFKSRFTLSITRPSNFSPSYSNMAINTTTQVSAGRTRETFLPTPLISAYLIAFHVSDFAETQVQSADRPYKTISRQGANPISQHALSNDMGPRITTWLSEYFEFDYYTMGQGQPMKNDHIALPDFPSGAMENWGMVNYREAYLLYDPLNTNLPNRIFIGTILSHELAHKWFGNLVTCFWWSNLWLNESFASFFEYFATHGVEPSLELDDQFVVDHVHSALNSDSSPGATPMNWTGVVTNPSITSHFSVTSYAKGASVLKMMEHFVGWETFRRGLSIYLNNNAYGLGTPELFYNGLRAAIVESNSLSDFNGTDIGTVLDSWIQNPGAPVLYVNVGNNNITVSQQRYQLTGTRPATIWQIPLTYTRGNDASFDSTRPVAILTGQSMVLDKPAGEEWVIFNIRQSGLYRVNYNRENWEMIAQVLLSDRNVIHKLNRAQIVNDVLYFVRSGDIDVQLAFQVLAFLRDETDYYVWAGALGQLDWIRRRLEHIPPLYEDYSNYLAEQMQSAVEDLGFEETTSVTSTILNRMQILNYACNLGHQDCVSDSLQKWQAFRQQGTLVPVNARRYVYCTGLREGDETDYNFLWERYSTSENTADMVVILRTLACTKDQNLIEHYLNQTLINDRIRIHDRTNAFSFALQGNPENLPTVLEFLRTRFADIRTYYGGSARLSTCISALATYLTDFEDLTNFQAWLYQNQLELTEEFSTGVAVVNTASNNLVWGNNVAIELNDYLRSRTSGASAVFASFTLLVSALLVQLYQ